MKKSIITLMLVVLSATSFAQSISLQQAQQRAEKFLKRETSLLTLSKGKGVATAHKAPSLEGRAGGEALYIFNADDGHGYVIVSGDERAREILGYSDKGCLTIDAIPDNLRALLEMYAQEIDSMQKSKLTNLPPAKLKSSRQSVLPLLQTKWDQSSPYNYYCPSGCPTGCVATAMAQILYYWGAKGYDIKSDAIPSYTTTKNQRKMPALEATSFDWDLMSTSYSSFSYRVTESGMAVAKLMQYCGSALKMDYASGGSNAWGADQVPAMTDYFGMDKGMQYIHRPDFTSAEWDNMMYTEVASGRPILYGGCGYRNGWGGHAFVLDGYNASSDTYHFNFGWGGSADGYFALSALRPSSNDFNAYADAVIGIQPDLNTIIEDVPFRMSVVDITYSGSNTFIRNSRSENFEGVSIFNAIFDYMNLTTDMDLGLGLFTESGEMIDRIATKHVGHYEPQDGFGLEFCFENLSFGAELPYGKYFIKAISKESNCDEWLVDGRSERHYIEVSLQEKELVLKPSVELVISSFSSGTVSVRNIGKEEATSNLYLFRNNSLVTSVQEDIPADGELHDLNFLFFSGSSSNIKICSDKYGRNILFSNYTTNNVSIDGYVENVLGSASHIDQFLQLRNPAYTEGLWSDFDVDNYVIGNRLQVHVNVTNKDQESNYNGSIQVSLMRGSSTLKTTTLACNVEPGKSEEVSCEFSELTYGTSYSIQIKNNGTVVITSPTGITYKPIRGIVAYDDCGNSFCVTDDDVENYEFPSNTVCVDAMWMEDIGKLKIAENPNCIYILPEGASIPEVLKGKNIVVNNKSEEIILQDGYSFGTSQEFIANRIIYNRQLNEGYDGENVCWGTLCLPFDVESISVDGQSVGWFHSEEDTGKSLWIMDLESDNGKDILYFKHAQSIEANKPYLITSATDKWGEKWSLVGKVAVFEGKNAAIKSMKTGYGLVASRGVSSGGRYDFIGSQIESERKGSYTIQESMFVHDKGIYGPFGAYVVDYLPDSNEAIERINVVIIDGEMGKPYAEQASVKMTSLGYATFSWPLALDFNGADVEAYIIKECAGNSVKLERAWRVPANTGLILKAKEGEFRLESLADEEWTDDVSGNLLRGTAYGDYKVDQDNVFVLSNLKGPGLYRAGKGVTVRQFKAYMVLNDEAANAKEAFAFDFTTDGIEQMESSNLSSTGGEAVYDLTGRQLSSVNGQTQGSAPTLSTLQKGIYVIGGKKYVVR